MRGGWQLEHGDALEVMAGMASASVDAIVTSPPYADQRDYETESRATPQRNRSRRQRTEAPNGYVDWIEPFLVEMLRVVSPMGSLMLNLGRIFRAGEEHPYALEVLMRARELGWRWVDTVIWHKPNAIPLSHPAYLHSKHEFVWWLAPAVDCYRGFDRDTRTAHSETSLRRIDQPYMVRKDERYMRRGKTHGLHPDGARPASVFTAGVGDESGVKHPAKMALKTALQLVSLTCPVDGLVLDPFAGSCTTGVAALSRGRRFIGIEMREGYLAEARERLERAAGNGYQAALGL